MAVIGANPEQLRSTAAQLTHAADQLQGSLRGLHSTITSTGIWRGPDSERFRAEWNSQSVHSLNAAVTALREGAEALRRNASEQDTASRADSGSGSGASRHGGSASHEHSAAGLHDMWNEIHKIPKESSGYRVQKVVGPDGQERYIVYIAGTSGGVTQDFPGNVKGIFGGLDEAQVQELQRIIKDKEVMLVGYSQGGIDAQNIAASGRLNVQQVVTFGSPVRNDLNISAIHLMDTFDFVPGTGIVNPVLYSASAEAINGNVEVFSARSTITSPTGYDEHIDGYDGLSTKWDSAATNGTDARAAESAQALKNFQGDVVSQVDIAASNSGGWGW